MRRAVQRSAVLRQLNEALPPSGSILNALARFDPFPRISGPPIDVGAARLGDRARPAGQGRGRRRGANPRHGVRAGHRGLGLGGAPGTRGDQRARRRRHRRHRRAGGGRGPEAATRRPSTSTPPTTSPSCGSTASTPRRSGSWATRSRAPAAPFSATPRTGRTTSSPRAWARPRRSPPPDAYGRGPVRRTITSLRGARARGQLRRAGGRRRRARDDDRVRRHRRRSAGGRLRRAQRHRALGAAARAAAP